VNGIEEFLIKLNNGGSLLWKNLKNITKIKEC